MHANKIVKLSFEQCMGGSKLNRTARSIWKEQDCQTRLQKNVGGQTSPNTGSCGMPRSRAPSVALGSGGCHFPASRGTAGLGGPPGTAPAHPAPERCPCGRWPGPHSAGQRRGGAAGRGCAGRARLPAVATVATGHVALGRASAGARRGKPPSQPSAPCHGECRQAQHGGSHAPLGRRERLSSGANLFSKSVIFMYLRKVCVGEMKKFA